MSHLARASHVIAGAAAQSDLHSARHVDIEQPVDEALNFEASQIQRRRSFEAQFLNQEIIAIGDPERFASRLDGRDTYGSRDALVALTVFFMLTSSQLSIILVIHEV